MAVKFTTLIKMDMDRVAKKEEYIQGEWGCIEERMTIWDYHIEVPCSANEEENKELVQHLCREFEEELEYVMNIESDKICCSVHASNSDYHVNIEDLYNTMKSYTDYLEEILDEHEVQECILTLELYSDIDYYIYIDKFEIKTLVSIRTGKGAKFTVKEGR